MSDKDQQKRETVFIQIVLCNKLRVITPQYYKSHNLTSLRSYVWQRSVAKEKKQPLPCCSCVILVNNYR